MKTDVQKTLQVLKENKNGIHSFDLNHIVGTTRSAARINDLKKLGYVIESKREKRGDSWGVRYQLVGETSALQKTTESKLVWETYQNEQGGWTARQVPEVI